MKKNEEFQNLVDMISNLAKNLQHVAQRLQVFLTKDEIVLQRIDNKKFCEMNGITARTANRWRQKGLIKFIRTSHGYSYLLKDVYDLYLKRNGRMKEKVIVGNRP